MCGILEERRKIMLQRITYEQDEKTSWAQSLVHTYSEHVDTNSKLVQTALNAMEEPEMAAFLQVLQAFIEVFLRFCRMSIRCVVLCCIYI